MVTSTFLEMYVQLKYGDLPGVTEKDMLRLLLPYVKRMKYQAMLIMTTKDYTCIHVLVRFHEPSRKDNIMERFVRNVYSAFPLPSDKKATDYITIRHKLRESDYANVADIVLNDHWGPAPGVATLEDLHKQLQQLRPYYDQYERTRRRIEELRGSADTQGHAWTDRSGTPKDMHGPAARSN